MAGETHRVTLIEGDGIGPEVAAATLEVLDASGVNIEWDRQLMGIPAEEAGRDVLPEETLASIRANRVALKGPLTTHLRTGFRSVNVALRQELLLYANVRPAKTLLPPPRRYDDVDLVLIRENTQGLYTGIEHYIDSKKNAAESIVIITREAAERVVRYAFEYARANGRGKVTIVHKANILKYSQGLFLDAGRAVAAEYPEIPFDEKIVDNMAMQLVLDPMQFDVMVTTNMFGDILSDLCSGLVGGLGLAPSANIGEEAAVFEAVHGSAPDIAGQDLANPSALVLSACLMLEHLGEQEAARRVRGALVSTLREGRHLTRDLGGTLGTREFARVLAERLPQAAPA
ncbi:MAG: NAD-dependent isocitrate dehydrogenase [Gemmatimonadetes bacterium]|nr:NAD-dependent isocitrate dehydrogenase [Gemmatimonadota bacterium]